MKTLKTIGTVLGFIGLAVLAIALFIGTMECAKDDQCALQLEMLDYD